MELLIYEDNEKELSSLKKCIEKFFYDRNIEFNIVVCKNKQQLFDRVKNADFLFLDIEVNEDNGIDIGIEIEKMNLDVKIIIITNYAKYAIDGYKINAVRYFVKPINENEFHIEMEAIIKKYYMNQMGFIDPKIQMGKIYYKDILYVEFKNRKTYLYLINGKIVNTNYQLKYWIDKLKSYTFSQPYKSFIVNLSYVSGFNKNDIIMTNDELIPLSRHYKKSFEYDYEKYLHSML